MKTQKFRHKFLTVWLIIILLADLFLLFLNTCNSLTVSAIDPNIPIWLFPTSTFISFLNIIFIVALFRWKKWGFWGLVATSIVSFIINLMIGQDLVLSILGFSSLLTLFVALQVGKEYKGWSQLE